MRFKSASLRGDHLQINAFPDPVLVEQKLQLMLYKITGGVIIAVREKSCLNAANMTLGTSTSASIIYRCPG